ncbi:homocysteine S-methyltransferase family protein [Cronobacter turicensis]|uniref:homocysteine S-methyltransferase family protein n=1 Tax=Cronobacter turicensis TaxID=413502 RepID=UPI0024C2BAEF|nr:homocysteine S-methyltransferase family protein [Cronobacter turicensis]ELY5847798.1 homocysteine S-methyltransferase family protein [Cronobacter turicensis]MDK1337185.1 homocysteine S-methyltransferase family protein [Cronobacter turicensis]
MSLNNPLTPLLNQQPFVVLDGALATELEARGCNLADSLWSAKVLMEQPELIYAVHLDYFRAGAQCAITASYQATPAGFAARGLDEAQSRALIARSAALAHLHDATRLPLVVYPNSGEQYDAVSKTWRHDGHACQTLAHYLDEWRAAGAALIGGCCRTTPADIAALNAQRTRQWGRGGR